MQGCVSAVLMMMATVSYYILPMIATTRLQLTIVNTLNWELILTSNGIILIIFNRSFRRIFHPRLLFKKTKRIVGKIFTVSMRIKIDATILYANDECKSIWYNAGFPNAVCYDCSQAKQSGVSVGTVTQGTAFMNFIELLHHQILS
ncbi:unnamed protein product [Cylicocyclus nassatus]|uniref:Uncharacterized protein n=1 Tax=Cylicocyclus nassatus TaxID=53992 RepID=A0AA36HAV1_CYLNA|nr:unnamed protein product [Cylicocyclus nassatus]